MQYDLKNKEEQASDDATRSNIAILCLPLVISFPLVSVLDSISNIVTLWYIVATDIVSAIPVLIKGFDLMSSKMDIQSSVVKTFEFHASNYAFFEMYNI